MFAYIVKMYHPNLQFFSWKEKSAVLSEHSTSNNSDHSSKTDSAPADTNQDGFKKYKFFPLEEDSEDYGTPTPPPSNQSYYSRSRSRTPLNLNGSLKGACKARTRVGTPCKISSLPGRDYCYRHQSGDSIMM